MNEQAVSEVFAVAGGAIAVPEAPVDDIEALARSARARRRRTTGAVAAAALAVIGLGTLVATVLGNDSAPSPDPAPTDPQVVRVENLAEIAWWANDVLHLSHVEVGLPRVEDLVQLGDGAVIGDREGRVVLVSADGRLTTIGHKVAGAPLAASAEKRMVAWVDPRERSPRLVLYDVASHEVTATRDLPYRGSRRRELDEGSYPIAMDGETVYFADQEGDRRWRPPYDGADPVDGGGLIDVSSAVVLRQVGRQTLDVVQPFFSVDHRLRGAAGAQLSPGGEYVLTRTGDVSTKGPFGPVRIYDARSGEPLWTGVRRGDQVLAATLGPDDEVTYVITRRSEQPQAEEYVRMSFTGPYELRTCHVGERTCFRVARFPHTGALPVLAG